jgi:hypothetical protein
MNEAEHGGLRTGQCADQPPGQVVETVIGHLSGSRPSVRCMPGCASLRYTFRVCSWSRSRIKRWS